MWKKCEREFDGLNGDEKVTNTVKYIPYEKKVGHCEKIVKTSTTNTEGKFWSNTPLQYVLFSLTLIDLYTDVTVDFDNTLAEFNLFNEKRMFENLSLIVSNRELNEFETILKMVVDDQHENLRSLAGYLDDMSEAIDLAFREALKALPITKEE